MYKRCDIFRFNKLEILVLDEADTLLSMGFKDTINQILSLLPKQRRTGLFSATQTKEIKDLIRAGLRNPVNISVRVSYNNTSNNNSNTDDKVTSRSAAPEPVSSHSNDNNITNKTTTLATPVTLESYYNICKYDDRPGELVQFLLSHQHNKIIIFCATCACVDYYTIVFNRFRSKGLFDLDSTLPIYGLHGKMLQKKRNIIYKNFLTLPRGVLFASDVVARGIDIPNIDYIIQLTAPKDPAYYVHRVGRTARAGKKGSSIIMLSKEEISYVNLLLGRGVPLTFRPTSSTPSLTTAATGDDDGSGGEHMATDEGQGRGYGSDPMMYVDIHQEEPLEGEVEDADDDSASDDEEESSSIHDGHHDDTAAAEEDDTEYPTTTTSTFSESKSGDDLTFNQQVLEEMKALAIADRAVLEAGSTAFMSFLRAYQEHLCSYIFKFADLDIGSVARGYALLRLPKIPETRGSRHKPVIFTSTPIDTSKIKYLHKEKEQARLRKIELRHAQEAEQLANAHDPTNSSTAHDVTVERKKAVWVPPEQYQPEEEKRVRAKKRSKQQVMMEEWDELAAEETTYRKFKKGKLSGKAYEKALLQSTAGVRDDAQADDSSDSDDDDHKASVGDDDDADEPAVGDEAASVDSESDGSSSDDDDGDSGKRANGSSLTHAAKDLLRIIDEPVLVKHTPIDPEEAEKTARLVSFWSNKCVKHVKQNKKRKVADDTQPISRVKRLPTAAHADTLKGMASVYDKKRPSAGGKVVAMLANSLSSKNKAKVNNMMMAGRFQKSDSGGKGSGDHRDRQQQVGRGGKQHGGGHGKGGGHKK